MARARAFFDMKKAGLLAVHCACAMFTRSTAASDMTRPRFFAWQLFFLLFLVLNVVLLYTAISYNHRYSCSTSSGAKSELKETLPQNKLRLSLSRENSSELQYSHRDCNAEVEGSFIEYLCRVESSVSFYSPKQRPLVVAKDISYGRYFARRDLQGWTTAFKNFGFDVTEISYREAVSLSQLSVFLCLGIATQDKHCIRPSSYHLLQQGQKVNQIHGLRESLWRKDGMCLMIREALATYEGPRNFTFPCWVLPADKDLLYVCPPPSPPPLSSSLSLSQACNVKYY